jgi:hypothetical protein
MYEDQVQRISERFEKTSRRIEARFELAIKAIDGFMAMFVAAFAGMANVIATVFKKSMKVILYVLLLLFVLIPLFIGFFLGLCFPGIWGFFISALSASIAGISIYIIIVTFRSTSEPIVSSPKKYNDWHKPIFLVGLGMNISVIALCIIYFQTSTITENFVIAPIHEIYNVIVNFLKTH